MCLCGHTQLWTQHRLYSAYLCIYLRIELRRLPKRSYRPLQSTRRTIIKNVSAFFFDFPQFFTDNPAKYFNRSSIQIRRSILINSVCLYVTKVEVHCHAWLQLQSCEFYGNPQTINDSDEKIIKLQHLLKFGNFQHNKNWSLMVIRKTEL